VTGGTGVVGRAFLPRLLATGWSVTVLTRDSQKLGLPRDPRVDYMSGDVSDEATVERLLATESTYDVVFHLAASLDYFAPLSHILATNAAGTAAIVRFARHVRAKRFVYASSIEAAGAFRLADVPSPPERESRPITSYGKSKLVAERHVLALEKDGIAPICLRIGNVYGPGWASFVIDFARAILSRGRLLDFLPVYGSRYWSPVWNEDVSAGLLVTASTRHAGIENLVGQAATVEEMFHLCADAMGVPLRVGRLRPGDWLYANLRAQTSRFLSRSPGEFGYLLAPIWPRIHRCFGMEDSAKRLGWRPAMPLREGILQTLRWARSEGLLSF
jgi:UDP-glucose 4-epimerase